VCKCLDGGSHDIIAFKVNPVTRDDDGIRRTTRSLSTETGSADRDGTVRRKMGEN
jgi:hypothetical protein